MPILDNFLFTLNRGYIGNEHLIEKNFEKKIKEVINDEIIIEKPEDSDLHKEMMYYLIIAGKNKYHVKISLIQSEKRTRSQKQGGGRYRKEYSLSGAYDKCYLIIVIGWQLL